MRGRSCTAGADVRDAQANAREYTRRCFSFLGLWPGLCISHRQNGIGMGSMCARAGGALAPMMYLLKGISPQAPMVLCGLCPLLGSALTLLLPETANKPLPDTIEDVEGAELRFDAAALRPFFFFVKAHSRHLITREGKKGTEGLLEPGLSQTHAAVKSDVIYK